MNILYISNQTLKENIGNPVLYNRINQINNNNLHKIDFIGFSFTVRCFSLLFKATKNKYDIIHIHFGGIYVIFSLLPFFLMRSRAKRIITFHGTDIHGILTNKHEKLISKFKVKINKIFSLLCLPLFCKIGFVSKSLKDYIPNSVTRLFESRFFIEKLGVDYHTFYPSSIIEARKVLGLDTHKKYFLFSSISSSPVKRFDLAEKIVQYLGAEFEILQMSNVPSQQVPVYLNAIDFVIITSDAEGSPNIVREALAVNKPVFSVQVGDVREQISLSSNSRIISRNPKIAATQISQTIQFKTEENTREKYRSLITLEATTNYILEIYESII